MGINDILIKLPSTIEWMVLFDVAVFREIAGDNTFKEMYFINEATDLDLYNYVILSSEGRFLSLEHKHTLINGESLEEVNFEGMFSMNEEYRSYLQTVDPSKAHCLALAKVGPFGKVLLNINIQNNVDQARAVFENEPSENHYALLQAIGVQYKGGESVKGKFIAKYVNKLPIHIHSGILNHFSRTDNCNIFFFNHGNIDKSLFEGLYTAYLKRKEWMLKQVDDDLVALTKRSLTEKVSMDWLPPIGSAVFPFGDVVPLGFLKLAIDNSSHEELNKELAQRLEDKKLRGLWPFESNDLETSVDSALVLQGHYDKVAVNELKRFWNGIYGYLPQIASENPKKGEMQFVEEKKHWCQVDLPTTCLIYAIRKKLDLPTMVETESYIVNSFNARSGLYFANPYMVDWYYANALAQMKGQDDLKKQFIEDLLSGLNEDYSVGKYDKVLSSAFASITLDLLGYHGTAIAGLQLYIVNNYSLEKGKSIPYYSSLLLEENQVFTGRKVSVNNKDLQVSLHRDTNDSIYTAIVFLALSLTAQDSFSENDDSLTSYKTSELKPIYSNESLLDYIEKHALIGYVE